MEKILLSTAYIPPIQYISKLLSANSVTVERHEHFCKQSYRNRCRILTANGLLDLVVPVARNAQPKTLITEVSIAYDTPWQKLHRKAIEAAYRKSPFYEYYIDDLTPCFTRHYSHLYDFNMQIMQTICRIARLPFALGESEVYEQHPADTVDWRTGIHPKPTQQIDDVNFVSTPYTQVFSDKFGFQPNLSILDLLFNMGSDMIMVVESANKI
ncbi:MAG: WbqC family protein [Bacteroidales bacterium]|nr:WbqC family protein [Bacteroidales bacterium]